MKHADLLGAVVALLCWVTSTAALSQTNSRYVPFSSQTTAAKGVLFAPDAGPAPHIGILVVHRTANFINYRGCTELAARGYLVFCMNPRSENNEAKVLWEDNALDVKRGMEILRAQPGIETVLLWGFSGGGATTSFYQAVAENGTAYCRGPNKLVECDDRLAGLPRADGLILVDANQGIAAGAVIRINGAVTNDAEIINEGKPPIIDPSLDPFSPANGFDPNGASHYSSEFKERYFRAQARRMNGLIELAQSKLRAIESRGEPYPDDAPFIVVKADSAELMIPDPSIHHATLRAHKIVRNDGTIERAVAESVRVPNPRIAMENSTFASGVLFLTVKSFLSANAMRATHSMDGLDYCSSNNSVPCALQSISVPLLLTAMGGNRYLRFSEIHYDLAKSADKDFAIIEGATHGQEPCVACEQVPGQYSNATSNFFAYVTDWIDARFGADRSGSR
jgi:hypothetical protein